MHTKATKAEQEGRTVSLLKPWTDIKQSEGLCEGMFVDMKKKERRTVKKPKTINSKSLNLFNLSITKPDQSITSDKWQ